MQFLLLKFSDNGLAIVSETWISDVSKKLAYYPSTKFEERDKGGLNELVKSSGVVI